VEGIAGKAIGPGDGANLLEPPDWSVALRDCDGAVERDDRRRANGHQLIVERDDHVPVRVLGAMRGRVNPGDRRLHVILRQLWAGSRELEQSLSFGDEAWVPSRTVLLEQRA